MENDSNDKRAPEYYTEINVLDKKEEILDLLESYNPVVHTNTEKDFDWLSDEGVSIIISSGKEELLYIDLDGEISLGVGGWHTHYAPYLMDYNFFKETLLEFIEGKLCAVSIKCDEKWMGSYTFYESEISEQDLVTEKEYPMDSILIKDTTREERERIVAESLGIIDGACDGCAAGLIEMYQDYIDGKKEIRDINMEFMARYESGSEAPERIGCGYID